MGKTDMTALVSAFARAYHYENNSVRIFSDSVASALLTREEYEQISKSMINGASFFDPEFRGGREEALRRVVDGWLSPSPLGRAAFAERSLSVAAMLGTRQYLILAAGYDTFAYRQPDWAQELKIFEADLPPMSADKRERLACAGIDEPENVFYIETDLSDTDFMASVLCCPSFDTGKMTFCSLLGIVYYLPREVFENIVKVLGHVLPTGSTLVFDYPDENYLTDKAGDRAKKQVAMAAGAGAPMCASYSYEELEQLLSDCGFLIYEQLEPDDITKQYFGKYNEAEPSHKMRAFDNVNYCLAVRKEG